MKKIRVGIVNYLNTKPLVYGLERLPIAEKIELIGDYPARLSQMLKSGQIDIGLVPVATLPELSDFHIVGNYCIGTEGEIASVALFSDVPMPEIRKIYLDYQSRSSVELLKYLMRESWGISPELVPAMDDSFRNEIKGTTAGLVIGDRAFEQRKISTFIYDLGSEWKAITGLPFVFATWVSTRPLPDDFIAEFDKANEEGMNHIEEIVNETTFPFFDLRRYYKMHLSYRLDARKRKAIIHFQSLMSEGT
ncbi:MAG: menaquinone biosynthesis protein [Chitinophagaceae bacterium]|nr:menaquinone biosynthesis protein [Chitinophagaceae bacterium]